jgi:hypothetical protein
MNYFKFPIDLQFDKTTFLDNCCVAPLVTDINEFALPLFNHNKVTPEFFKTLETLFDSIIIKPRIFVYPPYFNMSTAHIDGYAHEPVRWALNIPLFGTTGSKMNWFEINSDVNDQQSQGDRSKALIYNITTYPIDSLELLEPCIVRTDIPHNVTNLKSSPRAILSVRFERSIVDPIETICKKFNC